MEERKRIRLLTLVEQRIKEENGYQREKLEEAASLLRRFPEMRDRDNDKFQHAGCCLLILLAEGGMFDGIK